MSSLYDFHKKFVDKRERERECFFFFFFFGIKTSPTFPRASLEKTACKRQSHAYRN